MTVNKPSQLESCTTHWTIQKHHIAKRLPNVNCIEKCPAMTSKNILGKISTPQKKRAHKHAKPQPVVINSIETPDELKTEHLDIKMCIDIIASMV